MYLGQQQTNEKKNYLKLLATLILGCNPKYIYNMEKTGFFRASNDRTLFQALLTVMLCANLLGTKQKVLNTWNDKNSRFFKSIRHKNQLLLRYYVNKKSWMASGLLDKKTGYKNDQLKLEDSVIHRLCHIQSN